ncbi:hypothetical protein ACSBR2_041821 [Camellia fascicularis]
MYVYRYTYIEKNKKIDKTRLIFSLEISHQFRSSQSRLVFILLPPFGTWKIPLALDFLSLDCLSGSALPTPKIVAESQAHSGTSV